MTQVNKRSLSGSADWIAYIQYPDATSPISRAMQAAQYSTTGALIIGAGPAGLMAAQMISDAGFPVMVAEAKSSLARKFLMAGKSGLNLTKNEPASALLSHYAEAEDFLRPMINDFDGEAVQSWSRSLGQEVFTGSSGRVFPCAMKGSPLLRAWIRKLETADVTLKRKWRWTGIDQQQFLFETPDGLHRVTPGVTVLALGGASWRRLGSDGEWSGLLAAAGVELLPFSPANVGLRAHWSQHMQAHFGAPVKNIELQAGSYRTRADFVISRKGLEGSGIYSMSRPIRLGAPLLLDFFPDLSLDELRAKLTRPRGKASRSNYLRKTLGLTGSRLALVQEFIQPLVIDAGLASILKSCPVRHEGFRDIDEAISTAGGVSLQAVDNTLALKALPDVFCAGEMLDWEAPTGGYLLTACLATGRWAGLAASAKLARR